MKNEFYAKLVDLYAGHELPEELENELERAAGDDPDLAEEMASLRATADALRCEPQPMFTEESFQRILMKMYSRGVDVQTRAEAPIHLQYHLPMTG